MDRKKFIKQACGVGFCSCIGTSLFAAEDNSNADAHHKWKDQFIKHRYAKLIDILDANLDEQTKGTVMKSLGKECAKTVSLEAYQGKLEAYIADFQKKYGETVIYDKANGILRIETAPRKQCACPMVDAKRISKTVCQCSLGWQEHTYSTVLGKEVKARLVESVVLGNKRCVFEVEIQS